MSGIGSAPWSESCGGDIFPSEEIVIGGCELGGGGGRARSGPLGAGGATGPLKVDRFAGSRQNAGYA